MTAEQVLARWPGLIARHTVITGSRAKLVALVIYSEAHRPTGTVSLNESRVARFADCEREYVRDIVGALIALGLLEDTGEVNARRRHTYRFVIPEAVAA